MWFKNLRIYRLTGELPCPVEELPARLEAAAFRPCGGLDTARMGWVPALSGSAPMPLAHVHGDFVLLCARTQQRLLPPAAVREVLDEKLLALEQEQGRKPGRRERAKLKDEVVQTLLPRALTRSFLTRAILAPVRGLLLVDSATPARAEELLNLLRESLGSLPLKPFVPRQSPAELMTRWLAGGKLPPRFALGQHCDLRDTLQQSNVVRCRQQELATREVRNHLDAGKQVSALGLAWNQRLNFVLAEDLGVRSLKFADIAEQDAGVDAETDEVAQMDANFVLMSREFDRFVADLERIFGHAE